MIHPTSIVSKTATLHESVEVGPFCIIGEHVTIGEGTVLKSHVVVGDHTTIGKFNTVFQFASVGEVGQDLKFAGEKTYLEIGDYNTIRESATLHRGTVQDQSLTKVGSHNLFMVNAHVAHDCQIGSHCIVANNVGLAGHAKVGDYAIIGGQAGVHQFCQIGPYAMVAGASAITQDVMAFSLTGGNPAKAYGINAEGLKRKGFERSSIMTLRTAAKMLANRSQTLENTLAQIEAELLPKDAHVQTLLDSIRGSKRGVLR